jgi:hypothetical protein
MDETQVSAEEYLSALKQSSIIPWDEPMNVVIRDLERTSYFKDEKTKELLPDRAEQALRLVAAFTGPKEEQPLQGWGHVLTPLMNVLSELETYAALKTIIKQMPLTQEQLAKRFEVIAGQFHLLSPLVLLNFNHLHIYIYHIRLCIESKRIVSPDISKDGFGCQTIYK